MESHPFSSVPSRPRGRPRRVQPEDPAMVGLGETTSPQPTATGHIDRPSPMRPSPMRPSPFRVTKGDPEAQSGNKRTAEEPPSQPQAKRLAVQIPSPVSPLWDTTIAARRGSSANHAIYVDSDEDVPQNDPELPAGATQQDEALRSQLKSWQARAKAAEDKLANLSKQSPAKNREMDANSQFVKDLQTQLSINVREVIMINAKLGEAQRKLEQSMSESASLKAQLAAQNRPILPCSNGQVNLSTAPSGQVTPSTAEELELERIKQHADILRDQLRKTKEELKNSACQLQHVNAARSRIANLLDRDGS